jgi:glycerate kinase
MSTAPRPLPNPQPTPRPTPLRILVCPQEFKGSLDAVAATDAIADAARRALPDADIDAIPMADGGPGTMEIVARALGAELVPVTVADAYGQPVRARFALVGSLAVVESAEAVALASTAVERRYPLRSTSHGVGELIAAAAAAGAEEVILGVGGTACSDGGAGAARALGLRLFDAAGDPLPEGAIHLARLARVEDGVDAALQRVRIRVAVDVRNHLAGETGAAAVFGAQKGLRDWQGPALDAAVRHWAAQVREDLGREIEGIEGTGAGGGIPAGILATLPGTTIESGAALVAEQVRLREAIEAADLVITGEGSLDAQTGFGKAVAHVAALCREAGVPCLAVAGLVESLPPGVEDAEALVADAGQAEEAIARPHPFIEDATARLLERWRQHHGA